MGVFIHLIFAFNLLFTVLPFIWSALLLLTIPDPSYISNPFSSILNKAFNLPNTSFLMVNESIAILPFTDVFSIVSLIDLSVFKCP